MVTFMEVYPKRAFTFVESKPDEDIYEIRVTLKDVPGALAKAASLVAEAGINVKTSIVFTTLPEEKQGFWTAFIDVSKSKMQIDELIKKLNELDVALDVEIIKPKPAAHDVMHFPVLHGEERAVVMPISLLRNLFEEIEKILTPSGFAAVFYNAGKRSGENFANYYRKKFNPKTKEELVELLFSCVKAIGWGLIKTYSLDLNRIYGTIRSIDNIEGTLRKNKGSEPICHWTRGFLAGYLSAATGKEVEVKEVKCMGKGDEFCEFEIEAK